MTKLRYKLRSKLNPPDFYAKLVEVFLSPLLTNYEMKQREKWYSSEKSVDTTPVFIIGAPRTGSTLLYQLLANHSNLLYISNFTHIFASSLFTGFKLQESLFKTKKATPLRSTFGNTIKAGWQAPSECARFWYYYLPKNISFVTPNDISEEGKQFFQSTIYGLINKYDRPFLFKNMNAGQRIQLFKDIFPNAKYIFIKRDPLMTAQSILKTRIKLGLGKDGWWSIKPKNYSEISELDYLHQVIYQIYYIEKQIHEDLQMIANDNKYMLTYTDLCAAPGEELDKLYSFINANPAGLQNSPQLSSINYSKKITVRKDEHETLNKIINSLDWEDYKTS